MPFRPFKEKRSDTRAHLDESSRSTLSLFLPLFLSRARVPAGACVRACLFGVGAYELITFGFVFFFLGKIKDQKKRHSKRFIYLKKNTRKYTNYSTRRRRRRETTIHTLKSSSRFVLVAPQLSLTPRSFVPSFPFVRTKPRSFSLDLSTSAPRNLPFV